MCFTNYPGYYRNYNWPVMYLVKTKEGGVDHGGSI